MSVPARPAIPGMMQRMNDHPADPAEDLADFVVASPTQFIAYRRTVSNVKLDFSISWLFLTKVIKH